MARVKKEKTDPIMVLLGVIISILILSLLVQIHVGILSTPNAPAYKYKVVRVGNKIQTVLQAEAVNGWELVCITGTIHSSRDAVLRKKK